jgi:hypothetical protein
MRSPNPVWLEHHFSVWSPSKLNLMFACTKTLANIFNQLHCRLEGEAILVGDIPELDTLHE